MKHIADAITSERIRNSGCRFSSWYRRIAKNGCSKLVLKAKLVIKFSSLLLTALKKNEVRFFPASVILLIINSAIKSTTTWTML